MAQLIETKISHLIEQSDNIAYFVRKEEWDTVDELSKIRQKHLEQFFATPITTKHAKSVDSMIRKILAIDHQLIDFIELEKKKTFKTFANLQNNSNANQVYKNVATLK